MSDNQANDKQDNKSRHKERMQQQKAKVDERIANAQVEKG
ncbi:MAG: cob(I)yrinic acid a,c-diamide adenosyltransferase, partial [Paraglaciecola chathamensis]